MAIYRKAHFFLIEDLSVVRSLITIPSEGDRNDLQYYVLYIGFGPKTAG